MKLPLPPLTRFIPAVHSFWNSVKSGSDTTTKLIDGCKMSPPYKNCETVACSRMIMFLFVIIHRLNQLLSSKDFDEYDSLLNYQHSANKRVTFHKNLLTCHHIFKTIKSKELIKQTKKKFQRREVLPRRLYKCAVPESVPFAAKQTRLTSKNNRRKNIELFHGFPLQRISDRDNREAINKQCDYCPRTSKQRNTSWFCVRCRLYFCMNPPKKT